MNCLDRMVPGAMVMMVGLLPLAASQAHAQSSSPVSLLSVGVITLPSDTLYQDPDSNDALLGDLALTDTDPLGVQQETLTLPHSGSGIGSGWLIGGTLGAAAGLVGLASGGGSGAAFSLLRTPSTTVGPVFAIEPGVTYLGSGSTISGIGGNSLVNSGSMVSGVGGSGIVNAGNGPILIGIGAGTVLPLSIPDPGSSSGGGGPITPQGPSTPEPGALAMFGGLGLMFTAAKLRRRKR